jgi:hypothetical protein
MFSNAHTAGEGLQTDSFELVERNAGARPRQIDGSDVVQRHSSEKVVRPECQALELLG